jgi:UPF0755 protein
MPNKLINHQQQPINGVDSGLSVPKKRFNTKVLFWVVGITLAIIIGLIVSLLVWYNVQLQPVGNDKTQLKAITIKSGSTSGQISQELQKQSIIRSAIAFDIYMRLSGKNNVLQAGTYRLSPSDSVQQIVGHFVKGSVDTFNITFYPGATLTDTITKSGANKLDVTTVLQKAGFSDSEIKSALAKTYESPLFANKPAGTSLEGYVYGETYNFNIGATVEDILTRTFADFYKIVQQEKLIEGFASHNLNLYQGITMASIIQREASSAVDQKQVAQVFYSRLAADMTLGSDVTYQYIADKTGLERDPALDSPYNTRRYPGLPPGPISTPGLSALQAVAKPASGDYLYFLSGDDNVTYFARTNAEHEANIIDHCKIKCSTP